jgi:tetratricopeptide (TPR) repeat protein
VSRDDVSSGDALAETVPGPDRTAEGTDDSLLRAALGMGARRPPVVVSAGQVIDDAYRIERELGAGGMGVVYLARDLRLDRDVAIKLHRAVAGEPGAERLVREARAMAQLTHPHVATVYEVGAWVGHPYVAMEYVDGGTARTWLAAAPRTPREVIALYAAAARGLAAAHALGLVHRDFKPDNVLVGTDGRVRVADFGLARAFDSADDEVTTAGVAPALPGVTATGAVLGTPAYMAPEQRERAPVGPAADQYAFAVALWEGLAGERPFAGESGGALRPAPPEARMPRAVHRVLLRALEADPAARYPSMTALLADLEATIAPRRPLMPRLALAAAALGAVTTGGLWYARDRGATTPPPPPPPDLCGDAGDDVRATWTPARRDAMHAAFAATGRPFAATAFTRAAQRLDAYTEGLAAHRIAACRAGDPPRDRCLDRRVGELDAAIALLSGEVTPELVDRSVDLAYGLVDPAECSDPARLAVWSTAPADPAAVAAIEAKLAEARAHDAAGRYVPGRAAAADAVLRADALGDPRLRAEARYWAGQLGEDPAASRVALEEGARLAAEARDDYLAARTWIAVTQLVVVKQRDLEEADRFRVVADAAVVRAGSPPLLAGSLASVTGAMHAFAGRGPEAVETMERAAELLESVYLPDDPRLANVLTRLGSAYEQARRFDDADAAHRRAEALLVAAYGADHPNVARVKNNRANLLVNTDQLEAARALFEEVVASKEKLLGPDHPDLAGSLANLGLALAKLGRPADAKPHLVRARALAETAYGPEHPAVANAISVLADVHATLGEMDQVMPLLEQALAIQEKTVGAESRDAMETLQGMVQAELAVGDVRGARKALDRARAIARTLGSDAALLDELAADVVAAERKSR